MSSISIWIEPTAHKRAHEVIQDTWGHLIPKPNVYRGYVRIAQGQQDTIIMETQFPEVHNPLDFCSFSEHVLSPNRKIGVYDLVVEMKVEHVLEFACEDEIQELIDEDIEPKPTRKVEYKTISEIQIVGEME